MSQQSIWVECEEASRQLKRSGRTIRRWFESGQWEEGVHWCLPQGRSARKLYNVQAIKRWRIDVAVNSVR